MPKRFIDAPKEKPNGKMSKTEKPTDAEAQSLTVEHANLVKQQYEALQRAPYIRMSQSEADAYDERRLRIEEICIKLAKYRSK